MNNREKVLAQLVVLERTSPSVPGDSSVIDMILEYVSKHKLIVYGGIAIDTYLKRAGHRGIYSDDDEPDIDIYTPDIAREMYTITNMVFEMRTHKFVETIPSRTHQYSRRVRYEFGPNVIDLTPIGPCVFKNMPTFTANFRGHNLRFIDLPVIKMNLYFALTINPLQNVFRLRKDFERLIHVKSVVSGNGRKGGAQKNDVWEIGFHSLNDKSFHKKTNAKTIFSENPYTVVKNIKHDEFAPFLDFPGYVSYTDSSGQLCEIYFFPENFVFMPRNIYAQLYFFHVKMMECLCNGRNVAEYSRAIKYLENESEYTLDFTPMMPKYAPFKQIISSTQIQLERIYRPEKKFREVKKGEPFGGISGEKLN